MKMMNNWQEQFELYEKCVPSSIVPIILEENIDDILDFFKNKPINIINYADIDKYKDSLAKKLSEQIPFLEEKDFKKEFENKKTYIYQLTDFLIRKLETDQKSILIYSSDILFKGFENFEMFGEKESNGIAGFTKYMSFMRDVLKRSKTAKIYIVINEKQLNDLKFSNIQTANFIYEPIIIEKIMNKK